MSWANGRLCGFDVETTGADPEQARIVSATVVLVGAGRPTHTFRLLVDPGVEIPAASTAVHGITNERARAEGRAPADALAEITRLLRTTWERGVPVVAFNGSYDLTVLDRELGRHLGAGVTVTGPVVDPHIIDRALDRRRGKRTLEETCRHYRVRLDGAHDATEDALAAARLAWRLARHYVAQVGEPPLAELHDRQVEWSRQWADSLNQYWRSQGRDHTIDGTWPVRPRRA
ncbi:exonuclease domain-containing protein [Actinomadura graeca]|uniref:exonuclease domain-containing protein n=1 Tax=Actinomadura graeca TaxID=2750812 RepID=UPI001E459762|nr:exonuclease domain-containing protein [Actinomadura graeca]